MEALRHPVFAFRLFADLQTDPVRRHKIPPVMNGKSF